MPTRNISLTREQNEFVAKVVESGEYQNASEAMRDAVRALQQRREDDRLRLARLRAELQVGLDELERGDYTDMTSDELERWVMSLTRPPKAPKRSQRAR